MATDSVVPVTGASFEDSAVYEPTIGPNAVLISGEASNATQIRSIAITDGGTALATTGGFQSSSSNWGVIATLPAGKHILSATVTELSGATYSINSPYELITGIQNQPYVFQELDENSVGVVTRVSNYDGAGTLVSQASVTASGNSAAPFAVAMNPTATFVNATEAILTGTYPATGSTASVEIFDGTLTSVVDPRTGAVNAGAQALGYASLNPDGSWSFDAHVAPGTHTFTAVATASDGSVAEAQSAFTLVTGIGGGPAVYQEIDHAASGGIVAVTAYGADGRVVNRNLNGGPTINGGTSNGKVIRSSQNDVMTGDGTGSTTFLFNRGFGHDEITNFNVASAVKSVTGLEHDVLSLPQAALHTVGQVMRHTTTALDGDAVIHLGPTDAIKLDGVTKADLMTHPNVFAFHG
jgi:hypothetical protein